MQEVFCVGDPVTAMVLKCEEGGRRLALSTAHLEIAAGDMLRDKQAVYATAAQQVQLVHQQMMVGQVGRGIGAWQHSGFGVSRHTTVATICFHSWQRAVPVPCCP